MRIEVIVHYQNPSEAEIIIPDWYLGGTKQKIRISMFELIQLYGALERTIKEIKE